MPCYHPLQGYRSAELNPSGKRSIKFNVAEGYKDLPVTLPCGQCIGCRLDRSRKWAIRCIHEKKLHEENSFITLTYDDRFLPDHGSLDVKAFQKFMKLLRRKFDGRDIRYFMCGEYGEKKLRPHYHACLFNFDFPDKVLWKIVNGEKYYASEILGSKIVKDQLVSTGKGLWPWGTSTTGDVTFESAAYVARYITKKITGRGSEIYYETIDENTGEVISLKPEYVTMSKRPAIGARFYEKYKSDFYPSDFCIVRGKKCKIPKYYDKLLEAESAAAYAKVKANREVQSEKFASETTHERLMVREELQLLKFDQLKRNYETEES